MRVDDPAGGTRPRVRRTGGRVRVPRELRVSLLGTSAVTADGVECELPKGARRLVALLALNPRGLHRSDAARRLTPLLETASARASLRKALTRVRATRLPLIETDGDTLRLHPRVTVDVREAEALAARIADRSQPLPEDGRHEILMLEPLAGWDDEWADRARTGLRGRFLRALDGYARRLASRGDVDEAAGRRPADMGQRSASREHRRRADRDPHRRRERRPGAARLPRARAAHRGGARARTLAEAAGAGRAAARQTAAILKGAQVRSGVTVMRGHASPTRGGHADRAWPAGDRPPRRRVARLRSARPGGRLPTQNRISELERRAP